VSDGAFAALKAEMSDEDIMELTYHIAATIGHALFCKALRLEYDDVDEPVVEVGMPEGGAVPKFMTDQAGLAQPGASS
jgi:hypothetical protein